MADAEAMADSSAAVPDTLMLPEMIDLLSPVSEPAAVSWWPQTWGWAVLGGLLLLVLMVSAWRRYRHWRANRYRRAALQQLRRRLAAGEGAAALAEVLRRTALAAFPRAQVASLRGELWCDFLNQCTAPDTPCFDAPSIARLSRLTYCPQSGSQHSSDIADLTQRVERWIITHRALTGGTGD